MANSVCECDRVLSSSQLKSLASFIKLIISFKKMLNINGPRIDPCDSPLLIFWNVLRLVPI